MPDTDKIRAETQVWRTWRDKVLPTVASTTLIAVAAAGLMIWKELAVINVKLDQQGMRDAAQDKQLEDHEQRIRTVERK